MPYIRLVKITLEVTKNKVSKSNLIGCYSNKNDFIAQTKECLHCLCQKNESTFTAHEQCMLASQTIVVEWKTVQTSHALLVIRVSVWSNDWSWTNMLLVQKRQLY